jgi:hypothetical protein
MTVTPLIQESQYARKLTADQRMIEMGMTTITPHTGQSQILNRRDPPSGNPGNLDEDEKNGRKAEYIYIY